MKSLMDLIVDLTKDTDFGKEIETKLEGVSHKDFHSWLKDKGYNIHKDECKKIVDNKDDFKSGRVGFGW